jgi:hypothetical protein
MEKQKQLKKCYITLLGFCLLGWGGSNLWAQQGPASAGGDASGAGGSSSYSIGQTDYTTENGSNGTITQGLQQPFEIQVMTGIEKTSISLTCSVYPNPVIDHLILSVENADAQNMSYTIYSIEGKLIGQRTISEDLTKIPMTGLTNGFYLVKVYNSNNEVKTFKISKNQ